MFKNWFLNIKTRLRLKKNQSKRQSVNYNDAKEIGILLTYENRDSNKINEFIDTLKRDGKKVKVICINDEKEVVKYKFNYHTLRNQDISITGNFKNPKIQKFIETEFDYLFNFVPTSLPSANNIIASSKAKFRAGSYRKELEPCYDFMIDTHNKPNTSLLIDELFKYSKILSN